MKRRHPKRRARPRRWPSRPRAVPSVPQQAVLPSLALEAARARTEPHRHGARPPAEGQRQSRRRAAARKRRNHPARRQKRASRLPNARRPCQAVALSVAPLRRRASSLSSFVKAAALFVTVAKSIDSRRGKCMRPTVASRHRRHQAFNTRRSRRRSHICTSTRPPIRPSRPRRSGESMPLSTILQSTAMTRSAYGWPTCSRPPKASRRSHGR